MKFGIFIITYIICLPVFAQTTDNYVPPPLFSGGHLEEPDTRPESAEPIPPPVTPPITETNKPETVISRIVEIKPPLPKLKPVAPLKKEVLGPEDIAPPSNGIVKGPKTMPAVKKKSVEIEPTFSPVESSPTNILERFQEETKTVTIERVKSEQKPSIATSVDEDKTEWSFVLSDDQTSLDKQHELILMNEVIPALDLWGNARISIYSEAQSPLESNMNASRRLALSRALEIRKFLINQEISPNRIDVRAIKAPIGSKSPNIIRLTINK